jgi:methionyl aminopeptidase
MIAKTQEEITNLRKSGSILSGALKHIAGLTKPGVTTAFLDLEAEKFIRDQGGEPAFLNYKPDGAAYAFPAALCVSINEEVVHGIPSEDRVIQDGDLVMLDLGVSYNGYFTDAAVTVFAGTADTAGQKLADATKEALKAAIALIKPGVRVGDIGAVVEDLGGHSLGLVPHEKPYIGNIGTAGKGEVLPEGLVIAVEPIFTEGKGEIILDSDEWTYRTEDGSRSAETEHTILITKDGAEVLTA